MVDCSGDGACLIQINTHAYSSNSGFICNHNCKSIKCPNYIVCGEACLEWKLHFRGGYCIECTINEYGTLQKTLDNVACPICFESKQGIVQPRCNHTLCVECFKECYHGKINLEDGPAFPFPEIQTEYEEDPLNNKWRYFLPLIDIYESAIQIYESNEEIRRFNLARCPICRAR